MTSLAIFDYGAGNIFSLKNSLEREGVHINIINDLAEYAKYDGLLLPGVGNFDPAIKSLISAGFNHNISELPILGICLGMEMFFESSQEGTQKGFGIMNGDVILLPPILKVPHMGWNELDIKRPGRLLEGVKDGSWVYFVHSYKVVPQDDIVTAESDYGVKIPAVVEQGNYFGTQFHPEKSGDIGKVMLRNFIKVCHK